MIIQIIIGICVVLIIIFFILTLNKFNKYKVKIAESKSSIEITLAKRYDILMDSMKSLKGYVKHETEIMSEVLKARQGMKLDELNQIDAQQIETINKVFAISEQYPELKSSEMFVKFQEQISEENTHLAASKRLYNSNVSIYNQAIVSFPSIIVAVLTGNKRLDFIKEIDLDKKKNIELNF